ncbi:MAG TPA: hypothetical protein VJK50_03140 [Patescibacteria group bacterium]|nr:hypothetical protein [Patescibacteria group bacterium]
MISQPKAEPTSEVPREPAEQSSQGGSAAREAEQSVEVPDPQGVIEKGIITSRDPQTGAMEGVYGFDGANLVLPEEVAGSIRAESREVSLQELQQLKAQYNLPEGLTRLQGFRISPERAALETAPAVGQEPKPEKGPVIEPPHYVSDVEEPIYEQENIRTDNIASLAPKGKRLDSVLALMRKPGTSAFEASQQADTLHTDQSAEDESRQ